MRKPPDPRLHKLLGGDALAALRQRLRRHFERTEPGAAPGMLRLGTLSPPEHEALALLTGRSPRYAKSMPIDLALLDTTLREAGIAASLRDALEQIDGPIVHLASARADALARWSAVVAGCQQAALAGCLQQPAALGLLKRLARQDAEAASRLLERADAVLSRLPAAGLARAQLAAETLGDAHALDSGQATATLVLAVLRRLEGEAAAVDAAADAAEGDPDDPQGSPQDERARDVWARAGVLVNELARPALFLNLPVMAAEAPVGVPGEPGYLSLRRLVRAPPAWNVAGREVFVCENPNLVAIATDQLGAGCAPLVCTDGMPAAAQRTLLAQLSRAGADLLFHADFDWAGIQIANHVLRAFSARPWRFGSEDYVAAALSAAHTQRNLAGAPVVASWDADLAAAMQTHGLAIAEEALAGSLLIGLRE